jgi:glycerophosphoryl diester phosphodiesterase
LIIYLSFEHRYLKEVKSLDSNARTVAIYGGMTPVSPLLVAEDCRADGIAVYADWVSRELVELAHSQGIWVAGWTAGPDPSPETVIALTRNGVDFLDTAYPDKTRELIRLGIKS